MTPFQGAMSLRDHQLTPTRKHVLYFPSHPSCSPTPALFLTLLSCTSDYLINVFVCSLWFRIPWLPTLGDDHNNCIIDQFYSTHKAIWTYFVNYLLQKQYKDKPQHEKMIRMHFGISLKEYVSLSISWWTWRRTQFPVCVIIFTSKQSKLFLCCFFSVHDCPRTSIIFLPRHVTVYDYKPLTTVELVMIQDDWNVSRYNMR